MGKFYIWSNHIRFIVQAKDEREAVIKMIERLKPSKEDFGRGINVNERGFDLGSHGNAQDNTYSTKDTLRRLGYNYED